MLCWRQSVPIKISGIVDDLMDKVLVFLTREDRRKIHRGMAKRG